MKPVMVWNLTTIINSWRLLLCPQPATETSWWRISRTFANYTFDRLYFWGNAARLRIVSAIAPSIRRVQRYGRSIQMVFVSNSHSANVSNDFRFRPATGWICIFWKHCMQSRDVQICSYKTKTNRTILIVSCWVEICKWNKLHFTFQVVKTAYSYFTVLRKFNTWIRRQMKAITITE